MRLRYRVRYCMLYCKTCIRRRINLSEVVLANATPTRHNTTLSKFLYSILNCKLSLICIKFS